MRTILDTIIETKREEVKALREKFTYKDFEQSPLFHKEVHSIKKALTNQEFGVIAEIKRKSPSAGDIQTNIDVIEFAKQYEKGGACAISCLTDYSYFGGSVKDVKQIQSAVSLPILRKEFIIDELQLFESKAIGADAILLIAEALTKEEALHLTIMAQSLGLEVIMEFHDRKEVRKLNDLVDVVGINNRNLHIQQTNIQTSFNLIDLIPEDRICISESGIRTPDQIEVLHSVGFNGALIGESILKSTSPQTFTQSLNLKTTA